MGLGHSPRIVTDGLVLVLDAGNPKNYNSTISTNWTDTIGGNNGTLFGGTHHNDGPFVGAGYVEFDGTGDYLSLASSTDFSFSHDFTVEAWAYPTDITSDGSNSKYKAIFSLNVSGEWNSQGYGLVLSIGNLHYGLDNTDYNNGIIPINTWTHLAVTRSNGAIRIFVNGILDQTIDDSNSDVTFANGTGNIPAVGLFDQHVGFPRFYFTGYISNLRILKGTALYTSNFTPPTKPLTAITNTVLLTCQGNSISDASSSGHTITANGNAAANLGFPASAFEFDGTDDEVSISSYQLSTTNSSAPYTLSAWINRTGSTTDGGIITQYVNGSSAVDRFGLRENQGGKLSWWKGGSDLAISPDVIPTNVWKYVVGVKRSDQSVSIYVDGIEVDTGTDTLDFENGTLRIGRFHTIAPFSGNISQVSIYNKALTAAEVTQNYNATKGRYA